MKRTVEQIDQRAMDLKARISLLHDQQEAMQCELNTLNIDRYYAIARALLNVPNGARHLPIVQEGGQGAICNNRIGTVTDVTNGGVVTVDFDDAGLWQTTVYDIVPSSELQVSE